MRDFSADLVDQQGKLLMNSKDGSKAHPFNFTRSPGTPQSHSLQKLAQSFQSNRFVLSVRKGELQLDSSGQRRMAFSAGKGKRSVNLRHNPNLNAFEIKYP